MNEVKRQLEKKMSDTKKRAESVMAKVEQQKRLQKPKNNVNKRYYITFASFIALLGALLFVLNPWESSLSNTVANPPPNETITHPQLNEDDGDLTNSLRKYFKADGDVAYFLGSGNEYATFIETTTWLNEDFVEVMEDNSGATMRNIYHISEDAIELVFEEMVDASKTELTINQLNTFAPISTLLKWPLQNGETFEGKTVTFHSQFKTPYTTFENVIQITEPLENGENQDFFAENYGLIAQIYKTEDGYEVISLLASINASPNQVSNEVIPFQNVTTGHEERLPLSKLKFLDPLIMYRSDATSFSMTYEPLFDYEDSEIGVFSYFCDNLNCELAIVQRKNEQVSTIAQTWGTLGQYELSPNGQKVIFPFVNQDSYGKASISRTMLQLVNLNSFLTEVPASGDFYFSGYFYPVRDFSWQNDQTILLEVADIENYENESIFHWQNSKTQQTKELTVHHP
ncbi:MAG: hypothetical protein ABS944_06250 [Solibacillus sp.]|uniref:hypothetical protein n=1 Tax=Solibacillus sp. TaxID=1909654 RepID=UPI003316213E